MVGVIGAAGLVASILTVGGAGASPPGTVLPFDFNGDGYAELAVGAPGENLGSRRTAGVVHVLLGTATGPTATGDQLWHQGVRGVIGQVEFYDQFGSALASGDFDRDGFADLAIGVPYESVGAEFTVAVGAVQVLYGSPRGLTAARDQLWSRGGVGAPGATERSGGFGAALAVGDFQGDGFADLVVGMPRALVGAAPGAGQVVVLNGSPAGLVAAGAQVWDQSSPGVADDPEDQGENWGGEEFGAALTVGDVDGDGRDDLAIGVPGEDRGLGAVHVLLGSAGGLTSAGAQYLDAPALDPAEPPGRGYLGRALALADFNGDSRADLAAGRAEEELAGATASGGRVSVIYAGPGGVLLASAAQDWNLESHFPNATAAHAWFGWSVAAGDFTGDGVADLAVGASASGVAGLEQDGAVYVMSGSPAGLVESPLVLTQDTPGVPGVQESLDAFGMDQLATARLSGGAADWLVVGAPCERIGRRMCAGTVTVVPGSSAGLVPARSSVWSQARRGVRGTAEKFDGFGTVSG